jgi:hypothetical protein
MKIEKNTLNNILTGAMYACLEYHRAVFEDAE